MFGEVCDMDRRINENDIYNRPLTCEKCGGIMIFKGVGEYHCENCRHVEYDDYGKVRLYVEKHRGATSSEVSMQTGVSPDSNTHHRAHQTSAQVVFRLVV